MTTEMQSYQPAKIRQLLERLEHTELIALYQDNFPELTKEIGLARGILQGEVVNAIIDHCKRRNEFGALLIAFEKKYPELYHDWELTQSTVGPFPKPEPQPGCSGRIGQWIFVLQRLPMAFTILLVLLAAVIILGALFLRSIPKTLVITVSNEPSTDIVKTFPPIRVTNETTSLDSLPVKGDSPVTVSIQALNLYGSEISSDALEYQWKLCCNDKHNKTTDAGRLSTWTFEPPTDLASETLTVTVSNEMGFGMEVVIPFTITIR